MALVLISIGMGKGLDNSKVQVTLIIISFILCGFNFFVVIYTLTRLFDTTLSYFIVLGFLITYLLPPLLYDGKQFCKTLH